MPARRRAARPPVTAARDRRPYVLRRQRIQRAFAAVVALIALVSTALPMTLFVVGLQRIGAGRAAVYSTVEPVVTVVLASNSSMGSW